LVDDYEEDIDAFAYFEADVEGLLNWFNSCISDAQDVPDLAFVHFDLSNFFNELLTTFSFSPLCITVFIFSLLFSLQIFLVDHGGHLFGWGSNGYRRGLKEADEHIETLLNMYHSRNVFENTLIVVVSDHGGSFPFFFIFILFYFILFYFILIFLFFLKKNQYITINNQGTNLGHGNDHLTDLLVPVFFKGPGVAIQHLQTEIQNIHVAPTILHFLGITPPKYWTGRVLTEIFNPSENVNPGITMYGAEDWCGKIQKCSDIAGTDCGWCEDQGKAMLGSSLRGPFKDDCKDWIWNSSDCENSSNYLFFKNLQTYNVQ